MSFIRVFEIPISYTDTTGFVVDEHGASVAIPHESIITRVEILRTVSWDVIGSFQLGKAGDTDWLVKNFQHNLTGEVPDVESIENSLYVPSLTGILATWNQGGASQGTGVVMIQYIMLR